MEESHREEVAHHTDPESCACRREATGEALTGAHADPVLSCAIKLSGVPTPLNEVEGNTGCSAKRAPHPDPTQSETRCMCGNSLRRNWEIPQAPVLDGKAGR